MADCSAANLLEAREELIGRLEAFLKPLLVQLDSRLDHRIVRSVAEAVRAILTHPRPDQALMLTTFAQYAPPRMRLIHTVKRFWRLVHHPDFREDALAAWMLERGTREWGNPKEELVIVDGSELVKPYAEKMEYLAQVRNPLEKRGGPKTVPGYWWLVAVRTTLKKGMAQVLTWRVWSTLEPGFLSQNRVEEKLLDELVAWVGRKAVLVLDRGLARFALLGRLAQERARFVARLTAKRDFEVDEEGVVHLRLLAYGLPLWYSRKVYDPHDQRYKLAHYGFRKVRRKEIAGELTLVVQWLEGLAEPWLLLTNEPVKNEGEAWRIVEIYWRRMAIEQTLRYLKGEVGLESFRVREFASIERIVGLGMLVYGFLLELMEGGRPLLSLLCHLTRWLGLKEEKETVYKLKWGISRLLTGLSPPSYG